MCVYIVTWATRDDDRRVCMCDDTFVGPTGRSKKKHSLRIYRRRPSCAAYNKTRRTRLAPSVGKQTKPIKMNENYYAAQFGPKGTSNIPNVK